MQFPLSAITILAIAALGYMVTIYTIHCRTHSKLEGIARRSALRRKLFYAAYQNPMRANGVFVANEHGLHHINFAPFQR